MRMTPMQVRRLTKAIQATGLFLTVLLAVHPAFAQSDQAKRTIQSAPAKGDLSVAGNLGFAHPFDDNFESATITINGSLEWHLDDQLSLRGAIGYTEFDVDSDKNSSTAEIFFITANAVFGWPQQSLIPYVTGGLGLYDTDFDGPANAGDADIELGLNGGGGLDIGLRGDWALRLEGLFHGYSGAEPDTFFSGTAGVRYRF